MGKILWHTSMSLDGFIAAANDALEWVFEYDDEIPEVQEVIESTGSIICGRRSYNVGQKEDGPAESHEAFGGAWTGPTILVTHEEPADLDPDYFAMSGDIKPIVATALNAANGKNVVVIGADIARQIFEADLMDEILVHILPTLLGDGVRLYQKVGAKRIKLQRTGTTTSGQITTLRFGVIK